MNDLATILQTRADRVRSGIDAALDLLNALSAQAPTEQEAERFRRDAFTLVAALDEGARLLDRGAAIVAAAGRDRAP
jgi:hypothetical protein